MANKNLIRRMRQLLILVLVLAMTMSFAAMTAMAFDDSAQGNTVTIPVNKTWDDEGHENERPSEITVNLMNGNTKAGFVKLNAANGWNGCFTVPATDEKVTYTVSEEPVANYRCTVIQQPVADYFGVSSFGTKVTPASENDYIFDGDLIIANHGGDYYIWTKEPVTIQKQRLMDLINNANLEGLGKVLSEKNTKFSSGFSAVFERQQGKETITVTINSEADGKHIIFSKEKAWSLYYAGMLDIVKGTGASIKNTYVPQTSKDMTGTLKIKKMVLDTDGDYTIDDNTIFTFTVETAGDAKKALVLEPSETRKDEYQFVEAVNEGGTELKLKSGDEITIKGLPAREYTVIEKQTDGYTLVEIDGVKVSNQTSKAYTLAEKGEERALFTNQQNKPDTEPPGEKGNGGGDSGGGGLVTPPQKPLPPEGNLEIPETPVEPDTPAEPVEPSEKPLPDDKHTVTEVPKTGDAGADALALNLLLLSISALTGMAFYLRRKTTNR